MRLTQVVVSTGVPFLFTPIGSLEAIKRCRFDSGAVGRVFAAMDPVSIFAFTPEPETEHGTVHSRMFAHHTMDIPEDPATVRQRSSSQGICMSRAFACITQAS